MLIIDEGKRTVILGLRLVLLIEIYPSNSTRNIAQSARFRRKQLGITGIKCRVVKTDSKIFPYESHVTISFYSLCCCYSRRFCKYLHYICYQQVWILISL
jgi:hypothetical protein